MSDLSFTALDLIPSPITNIPAKFTGATAGFSFYNSTGIPVYVTGRNGIVIKVDPCYDTSNVGRFTIRQNITFNKSDNIRLPSEHIDDEIVSLFYNMYDVSDNPLSNKRSMHYDSAIELKTIKEYDGTIYLRNLDLSVTINSESYDSFHPYTQKVSMERILDSVRKEKKANTNTIYRLVDNEKILTTMYVRNGEEVIAVKPIQDYSIRSGLYIIYNKMINKITKEIEAKIVQSRVEDHGLNSRKKLEPIFFNTYEEALHHNGSSESERMKYDNSMAMLRNAEVELKNLSLELERQRKVEDEKVEEIKRLAQKENIRDKIKISEIELHLKSEQQKLTEMEFKHKVEMMRMKEEYEEKLHQRKTTSDFIKMAPMVIGGIAGIAGLIYGKGK